MGEYKTRFDIKDKVYFMYYGIAREGIVESIHLLGNGRKTYQIFLDCRGGKLISIREEKLFETKEKLYKNWR